MIEYHSNNDKKKKKKKNGLGEGGLILKNFQNKTLKKWK